MSSAWTRWADDGLCVLQEIGWVAMNENEISTNETMMMEDISTFPPTISAALMGEEYEQCLDKIGSKELMKRKKCSYPEEEMAPLADAMAAMTRIKCFHMVMEYSCRDYVTQLMKNLGASTTTVSTTTTTVSTTTTTAT